MINYAHKLADIPENDYYLILVENSFTYEDGYERINGSPSTSTHHGFDHIIFENTSDVKAWIVQNLKTKFKVVKCTTMDVKIQATVEVKGL
jgi:hypothetical protein